MLAASEYSAGGAASVCHLALRQEPLAKLSDLPEHDRNRSTRFNNVWRPLGWNNELRVLFLDDGACWGAAVWCGRVMTSLIARLTSSPGRARYREATRLAVRLEATAEGRRPSGHRGCGPAAVSLGR